MSTYDNFEARIDRAATELEQIIAAKKAAINGSKAAAIMAGVQSDRSESVKAFTGDAYDGTPFLSQVKAARMGDPEANAFLKAILGTSNATGLSLVPNNFVAQVAQATVLGSPWRQILNVVSGVTGAGVDIPYDTDAVTAAILQGSYGSNKDVRDFHFGEATATLYQIAQIADIGNQLLRQSNGAAEAAARRRLGLSIGLAESAFVVNGTGSSQPNGILPAMLAFGDVAAFKTTLASEPRAATLGKAIGALEARGQRATAIVLHPTTLWATVTEGLGTSYAGGWAISPAEGPATSAARVSFWNVPAYVCTDLPTATGLVLNGAGMDMYLGAEMTIDVSSEAGNRFDQNITGFRAEELFGFNAAPYVATGMIQKVLGL